MIRLAVTHAARRDLKAIARYSEQEWGAARKKLYMAAIRERFAAVLHHSALGSPRDDLGSGARCLAVGRHLIFYRVEDEEVVILRVLHQRMDVKLHF